MMTQSVGRSIPRPLAAKRQRKGRQKFERETPAHQVGSRFFEVTLRPGRIDRMTLTAVHRPCEMSGVETVDTQLSQAAQCARAGRDIAVGHILEQNTPVVNYRVAAEEVAPAIEVSQKADHVAGMARCLENLDPAFSHGQLVAIAKNRRDGTHREPDIGGINARAFGGR
jgi:hypothetical protein